LIGRLFIGGYKTRQMLDLLIRDSNF